jgi:RNA polymerase sigma-70 factor (ECF subfamily)
MRVTKPRALPLIANERLARLSRDHRARLERFFRRRGCQVAVAEDLTQEVFARLAAYPQLEAIANPGAFLSRTAANLLRDTAKAARRRPTAPIDRAADALLVDPITPERILAGRQDIALVAQALADLETRTQRMFVMHRIEHLRHRDIAAHFGLSISLVEKCLRSAHGHLAEQVQCQRLRKRAAPAPTFSLEQAA